MSNIGRRPHNKSGKASLSISSKSKELRDSIVSTFNKAEKLKEVTTIRDSDCIFVKPGGTKTTKNKYLERITLNQKKQCHVSHVSALLKFGQQRMSEVDSSKTNDSLSVSHLCGHNFCCNQDHLLLETKKINDERSHCHFFIRRLIQAKDDETSFENAIEFIKKYCPHSPPCSTIKEQASLSDDDDEEDYGLDYDLDLDLDVDDEEVKV